MPALESADDEHGFSWWLAVVSRAPFQHSGRTATTAAGVQLINKGWYLTVKYYERTPPTALDTFILTADEMIIDAEGVIFTEESLRLDIAASAPLRALRPRAARAAASASLMRLASSESVIGQIEAHLKALSL